MAGNKNELVIRDATTDDMPFVLGAFDSTLPYLASIGAGEMWGSQPFSNRDGFEKDITETIQKAEANPESDERRLIIVERPSDPGSVQGSTEKQRVALALIKDRLPYYITERAELGAEVRSPPQLLFLEVLLADFRVGEARRGVGPVVVEYVRQRAIAKAKKVVYVDCWNGPERRLNRYYEGLGFTPVGEFSFQRKSGSMFNGTLFRMHVS